MTATDWNPEMYLKYKNERTQPSIDLVSRIKLTGLKEIIDIGCGPGNSTQILSQRWPYSNIIGVDNSSAMIQKAKLDYPEQEWLLLDAGSLNLNKKYDLVFSNATIQWIPDHEKLMASLLDLVEQGGALAIQVPMYSNMPINGVVESVSNNNYWKGLTKNCINNFTFHSPDFYYIQVSKKVSDIDLWTTSYFHIMDSHKSIVDMIKSTGLKPYLDVLKSESDKLKFESDVLREIKKTYPEQINGKVLFPFERLFFVAYRT